MASVPSALSSTKASSSNASCVAGPTASPNWGTRKVAKADKELEALLEVYGGAGGV